MYNGIGLQTARGSGTNGYVQANMANLLLSKKRVAYNSEADIKRAEAEINKQPNKELLEHNRKRHIELKCADFEMLMENKGFDEAEIQKKVNEYRKLLQSQVASGELDIDAEMDSRDTHVRAKAAIENRGRMRAALGIKDDFVDGTSFEKLNKNADLETNEAKEDDCKKKKKRDDEVKKSKKVRKTASSSSSSSSSSSEKSSSDDSSESSSDSDDSSTNSVGESSESNSSEVLKTEIRKKVKDIAYNKRNLSDRNKESKHSHRHEIRHLSGRRNGDDDFSDREKRQRHDSSDYYDRSCRHQHHNDDHVDYRRFRRSYGYDDGGRRNRYPRHYDHRYRRNDAESDRRRKHDRVEKRYRHEDEKRSYRRHHSSSDSDTNRKHKYDMADHSDDEDQKQMRQYNSNVKEEESRRSKLREITPDTKEIKVEPALSPDSVLEESNRSVRNKTPITQSNIAEIALPKKQLMEGVEMEVDVQESKKRIHNPNEDEVGRSSEDKRSRCPSSEIRYNSKEKYRHDTTESEDGTRSSSSSNDEFLHHSGSARSSTTTSNGGAAENILNRNSSEICSPSHSPKRTLEMRERGRKLWSRESKAHSSEDNFEKYDCNKSLQKHRSNRDSDEGGDYKRHGSRGNGSRSSKSSHCHLSRLESDHDDSESDKRRHRHSDNFRKRRRDVKSSELKFRRSESHESKYHSHYRSASSGRLHRLSRQKSLSNDSLRKNYHKSRSRSDHSKYQVTRSRSPTRHHNKYSSENRRTTSHHHIRKFTRVSSRKRSYSPKSSDMKRSISRSESKRSEDSESVKGSESVESTSEKGEERIKRRRLDSSTSKDDEDIEDSNGKRSRRSSSESSGSSSSSSQSSVARTRQHSNDNGKKRHHRRSSLLREPIDESD